ncbi:hypothetical protein ACFVXC_05800 [Streptomyces sp. NPDC058257]|uniref:hypothetical protein n=1 Tax=Streptomyces sp. NPDC058257 TaxID=3346409 RepID=UPI0036E7B670
MARYVMVSIYEYDKYIKDGPFELDDPSQEIVLEGQKIMLEADALAAGYHYAEGGAFATPEDGEDKPDHGHQGRGHQEHQQRGHGKHGKQ